MSFTLTVSSFTSSNANVRSIAFGSNGAITLTGSGAAWNTFTATNFTATGSKTVNLTYSGAVATSIAPGPLSEANSLNFNVTAGSYAITTFNNAANYFGSVNFQGFTGTAPTAGTLSLIYGNLTLGTTITSFGTTGTTITFAGTGTQIVTSNGKTFNSKIIQNIVGGTLRLADPLAMSATVDFALQNGILDLNGTTLTVGAVNNGFVTYLTGTRSILFNGGTLVCPYGGSNAFANNAPTGFTTSAGTGAGKISFTASATKQMLGGGGTYNCTVSNDGTGALTIADANIIDTVTTTSGNVAITGSNTITTIANAVQPVTFTFTAGTTQTITNWNVNGTAGNLVTIQSASASSHTLSKSSGIVSAHYLSISRSTATGGAAWYAGTTSTNGGSNSGWIFAAPNFPIIANSGTYAITGRPINIYRGTSLSANSGSYAVTGNLAIIFRGLTLNVNNGSYTLNGQSISIYRGTSILANNGSYSLTGNSINISRGFNITVNNGSYILNGYPINVSRSILITANNGSYLLSGQAAIVARNVLFQPQKGIYSLTGRNAIITYTPIRPVATPTQYFVEIRSFTQTRRI